MAADLSRYLVIVLAAGLGKRLNPLTQILPKPVIPLLGEPLCVGMIRQLANHGARCVHVNASYLSKTLENELRTCLDNAYAGSEKDKDVGGVKDAASPMLRFWHEPERLETGGAILRIWQDFCAENREEASGIQGVFVVSGDLVGEVPIPLMLRTWEGSRNTQEGRRPPQALIVTHKVNGEKSTGVWTRENGTQIVGFWGDEEASTGSHDCEFGGYQIIDPRALEGKDLEVRPGNVIDLVYRRILAQNGRILAVPLPEQSVWHNVGTPAEFFRCIRDLEARLDPRGSAPHNHQDLGRHPVAQTWSGTCLEVGEDYSRLVNLINAPVQQMRSQPTTVAINEFEQKSFDECLIRFLTSLREHSRMELAVDAYSDYAIANDETQKDLRDQMIMQVFVCSNALIQLPHPVLVGGRLFLELALSQRYPREASLDWLSLLVSPRPEEPAAYS